MNILGDFQAKIDGAMKDPRRRPLVKTVIILVAVALIVNGLFALRTLVKLARDPRQVANDSLAIIAHATSLPEVESAAKAIVASGVNGALEVAPVIAWLERDMDGKEATRENYGDDFAAVLNAIIILKEHDYSGASQPVLARIHAFHPKEDIVTGYRALQLEAQLAMNAIKLRKLEEEVGKAKAAMRELGLPSPQP